MLDLGRWCRSLFVLFVVVHLLVDLAVPSSGAFRFNPDESVVGVRVQPVQPQDFRPVPQVDPLQASFEAPRVELGTPDDLRARQAAPELIAALPRRDPSSDRSLQRRSEDPLTPTPQA